MKPPIGSHYFTNEFDYDLMVNTAIITSKSRINLRKMDPWALCYKEFLEEHNYVVHKIQLVLQSNSIYSAPEFESFKRRISFLRLNNPGLDFEILKSNSPVVLYNLNDLLNRPKIEIINPKLNDRNAKDVPGRLEKDFQAFIFGGTLLDPNNPSIDYAGIYRRLGVLGQDFYSLKNSFKVLREFPTGIYKRLVSKNNRILPTYFTDIVTFNKRKELAVIELKLNDSKIEVISQLLDYALFFRAYKTQICPLIKDQYCPANFEKKSIACYVANNRFHLKFNGIKKYYRSDHARFGFKIHMIYLGVTETL